MTTAAALRREGNEHAVHNRHERAVACFRAAVELFRRERAHTRDSVDEFVQSAGNLCALYHKLGERTLCVATALDTLATYAFVPKAYAAIGMCIIDSLGEQQRAREQELASLWPPSSHATQHTDRDGSSHHDNNDNDDEHHQPYRYRLPQQEEAQRQHDDEQRRQADEQQTTTTTTTPLRLQRRHGEAATSTTTVQQQQQRQQLVEAMRSDPLRFVTKMADMVCSVDEAHMCLCRAVCLSRNALQSMLSDYVESAVRLISEQVLSAAPTLERSAGAAGLLDGLCPLETTLPHVPTPTLATALAALLTQHAHDDNNNNNHHDAVAATRASGVYGGGGADYTRARLRVSWRRLAGGDDGDDSSRDYSSSSHCTRNDDDDEEAAATHVPLPPPPPSWSRRHERRRQRASITAGDGAAATTTTTTPPMCASQQRRQCIVQSTQQWLRWCGAAAPRDFALSGAVVSVRVCHSERGGVPRGVALVRAAGPFAVAVWLHASPRRRRRPSRRPLQQHDSAGDAAAATVTTMMRGGDGVVAHGSSSHCSEDDDDDDEEAAVAGRDYMSGSSSSAAAAAAAALQCPLPTRCVACGREMEGALLLLRGRTHTCIVCGAVTYCSTACARAYERRHALYECALYLALRDVLARLDTPATMLADAAVTTTATTSDALDAPATSSSWDAQRLLRHTLPLCIAVYSGLQCRAAGWQRVATQLARGVRDSLIARVPAVVRGALEQLSVHLTDTAWLATPSAAATCDDAAVTCSSSGGRVTCEQAAAASTTTTTPQPSSSSLLWRLLLLVRLYAREDAEHGACVLYSEKLLLRHACEPNCYWDDAQHAIVTARFVHKGEELTMTVDDAMPQHWPHTLRRRWLQQVHGIDDCACVRCGREAAMQHIAAATAATRTRGGGYDDDNNNNDDDGDAADDDDADEQVVSGSADVRALLRCADTTDKLLMAVRLRRPMRPDGDAACASQPTAYFHALVQRTLHGSDTASAGARVHDSTDHATTTSTTAAAQSPRACLDDSRLPLTRRLRLLYQELLSHVQPTHYLLGDVQQALCVAAAAEGDVSTATQLAGEALLYHESMWVGATVAKRQLVRDMPLTFGVSRRSSRPRVPALPSPPGQRRSRGVVTTAAAVAMLPSPTTQTLPSSSSSVTTTERSSTPLTSDYAHSTLVETFYGSYESWYS